MITTRPHFITAVLVAGALLATPRPSTAQAAEAGPTPEIVVTNNAYLDMHVYGIQSGATTVSIGMVTGLTTERFPVPRSIAESGESWRVLVDPIGGFGSYLSDPILMSPDDEVDLTIANNLNLSTVTVQRVR